MQDKRDGERRRVVKHNGEVFGLNRKAERVELEAGLRKELESLPYKSFDIDAEIEGKFVICFDALDLNGDISELPYSKRLALLTKTLDFIPFRKYTMVCPAVLCRKCQKVFNTARPEAFTRHLCFMCDPQTAHLAIALQRQALTDFRKINMTAARLRSEVPGSKGGGKIGS